MIRKIFDFSVYTLIVIFLKFEIYINFIILFGLYNIYCIELKCGFRYNITKSHQKYIKC